MRSTQGARLKNSHHTSTTTPRMTPPKTATIMSQSMMSGSMSQSSA